MSTPLLIENGTILTTGKSPAVLPRHSLLIEDGYITRLAPKNRFGHFTGKRLDASGKVVMPGLINAHTHFYSTFARGLTKAKPSADFQEVLKNLWWRLDSALSLEDCYYSALVPLLEAIRHGTTTLIDHHASPNAVRGSLQAIAKAVRQTGLRACLCYELSDRDGRRIAQDGLEENAAFIRECAGQSKVQSPKSRVQSQSQDPARDTRHATRSTEHASRSTPRASTLQRFNAPRLTALFGLHAAFTLTNSTLAKASALGRELGAGFHIHVAEAQSDQAFSLRHHHMRVVERLSEFGILGPQTIAAHCVHVNRKEMDLLAETRTTVVHNPQSNLNNAVGVADILSLAGRGLLVGLGTDAMTTNMLEELRVALWAQHLRAQNPSVGFSEVVAALFLNNPKIGQRIFQLPLGELREGCAGDVILVDYDPPTPLEAGNCFGHLVFGLSQAVVDTTIVGGKVLMQNKQLTLDLDEPRINARARELAKKLWKRM